MRSMSDPAASVPEQGESVAWTPRRTPRRLRGPAANLAQLFLAMWRQFGALGLQQAASSLTLLSLLAMVPMAAVGLLVLTSLPAFEPLRIDVERFLAENLFLPAFSDTVVRLINQFVGQAERLSAIGTIAFLATGLLAMLTIDQALNAIWRTPRPRPLAYRLALYWVMLTVGPVMLGLALALHFWLTDRLPATGWLAQTGTFLVPLAIGTIVLAILYRAAPNERVLWRHALVGAIVAILLLEGLRRLFGLYVANFPAYTLIYGAFAALPLFLLWVYGIWMAVLFGALVTANLRYWGVALGSPHLPTPAGDFDRLVRVLSELVNAGGDRVPSLRFRADFDGDPVTADRIANLLAAQGYLLRMWPAGGARPGDSVWGEYWLPAAGLAGRTLRPLFAAVWSRLPPDHPLANRRMHALQTLLDPAGERLDRPIGELLAKMPPLRVATPSPARGQAGQG
jgi:membrane protein